MSDPSAQSHTNESRRVVSEVEGLRAELKARDREIQTWKDTVRERTYELSQAKKEAAELRERAENAESMNVSISVCANHTAEIVSTEVSCWVCEAYEANERAEKAEAEVKEYEFLFELADKRTKEATAAWREATGRHNVSPDLGVLLEWLLGYREHAEKLAEALETISEAYAPSNHPEEVARAALAAYRKSQSADTSLQVTTDRDTKSCSDLCQTLIHAIEIDHDYGCECSACRAIAEHRKVAFEATILQEKDTHFACDDETVLIECAVKLEALGGYGDIADMLWAAADTYTQEET